MNRQDYWTTIWTTAWTALSLGVCASVITGCESTLTQASTSSEEPLRINQSLEREELFDDDVSEPDDEELGITCEESEDEEIEDNEIEEIEEIEES